MSNTLYALFFLNRRMLLHVCGFAKQLWNTVVGSALALTVKPLTWKRLMSRGFPAFFRQFWLHFRKNFRKNLCMGQRETNESVPATGSTIWVTSLLQIKQQIKQHSLTLSALTLSATHSSLFFFLIKNVVLCNNIFRIMKAHLVYPSLSYCHRLP